VADKDLITMACNLLLQLLITVQVAHQWVKWHYKGKRELKHDLNNQVDELADELNKSDRPTRQTPHIPHFMKLSYYWSIA
jgi:hypothetical protein